MEARLIQSASGKFIKIFHFLGLHSNFQTQLKDTAIAEQIKQVMWFIGFALIHINLLSERCLSWIGHENELRIKALTVLFCGNCGDL